MNHRRKQQHQLRLGRFLRSITSAATPTIVGVWVTLSATGCTHLVEGQGSSMLYDPFRVGGLPAVDGPSGPRANAPKPTGTVENTDGGEIDRLALLSINDIEEFWKHAYSQSLKGTFRPVDELVSYDSDDPTSPRICGAKTYDKPNAFFTADCDLIAWDRGVLFPTGQQYFGDVAIAGVLAHEYGHAIQQMAKLVTRKDPSIVLEQQADCLGGVYLEWVAEGQSPRFKLSTGNGLDHVLAGLITMQDPLPIRTEGTYRGEHGSAMDRVSAFQIGFDSGVTACAAINVNEIKQRRGDLPKSLQYDLFSGPETGEVPINKATLSTLMEVLEKIFSPRQPPTLSYGPADCPDAKASPPASYCPNTNTIAVDLPGLQTMGVHADFQQHVLPQGDDTALSVVMSRYVLDLQQERGLALDTPTAALRTACLTGVAHRKLAEPVDVPSGSLVLTAGDLDEAVSGLLTNQLAASDVDGVSVPAGFTRINAFNSGVIGTEERCYQRFG